MRGLELGFEADFATREAIDSELFSLASERRVHKDSFLSVTFGHAASLGSRVALVPVGGIGLGILDTRRYRYSVAGGAVVVDEVGESAAKPVVTLGADLRARVVSRLDVVGGYRMHLLLDAGEGLLARLTQHRFTIGLQLNAGGVQ